MIHYRSAWISDVHLGTHGANAGALLNFLRDHEFDTLYVVGDLIDIWSLRRRRYWPQVHNDVIQKLLRKGRKGARVIYIPGNHDEFVRRFTGEYGSLTIVRQTIHQTADGKRLLIMHGDELDTVVQNVRWLAFVGDVGYQALLNLNGPVNAARRWFGLGYWSLSAHVKKRVKNAVSFIGAFEEAIVRYAKQYKVDGVLCGHIHSPAIRQIGDVMYYNSGDFVESLSALVEHADGRIELLTNLPAGTEPSQAEEAEAAESELPTDLSAAAGAALLRGNAPGLG